jgi:hypothetical protein
MWMWLGRLRAAEIPQGSAGTDCRGDICVRYGDFDVHVAISGDYRLIAWQMA